MHKTSCDENCFLCKCSWMPAGEPVKQELANTAHAKAFEGGIGCIATEMEMLWRADAERWNALFVDGG